MPDLCGGIAFFFFNDTATTEIYTLSLHDALPISARGDEPALLDGLPVAEYRLQPGQRCNRPSTTLAALAGLKPVFRDGQTVKEGRFQPGQRCQRRRRTVAFVLVEGHRDKG